MSDGAAGGADAPGHEALSHWEGEPLRVWEELWEVPRLEAYRRLGSTNDRVRELARIGAPALTTVIAEEQTAGRGRSGRRWASPPGMGLWISVLLRPDPGPGQPLTPVVAGVAAARAAEEVAPELEAGLKWPNDVVVAGRKVAGILCEATGSGAVVVGIGVNCRQGPEDFPAELRDRAASLEMLTGGRVSRGELAGALVTELRTLFDPAPPRLEGALAEEVARRDVLRGRRVRSSTDVSGLALGIDPDGALRVEEAAGAVRRVVGGTVRAVDATGAGPDARRQAGRETSGS